MLTLVSTAVAGLGGCASLNAAFEKDFECPVQDGITCADIRTIQDTIVQPGVQPVVGGVRRVAGQGAAAVASASGAGVPMWRQGSVMEVHIAGFVDSANLLHADSVVYTVLDPGGWATR